MHSFASTIAGAATFRPRFAKADQFPGINKDVTTRLLPLASVEEPAGQSLQVSCALWCTGDDAWHGCTLGKDHSAAIATSIPVRKHIRSRMSCSNSHGVHFFSLCFLQPGWENLAPLPPLPAGGQRCSNHGSNRVGNGVQTDAGVEINYYYNNNIVGYYISVTISRMKYSLARNKIFVT